MRMSLEEYRSFEAKRIGKKADEQASKFRNKKKEINGIEFDSVKEARHYVDLLNWQASGQIRELKTQQRFSIDVNGEHICDYIADFTYLDRDDRLVVVDVKSKVTRKLPSYRLKLKLMKAVHGITIQEV